MKLLLSLFLFNKKRGRLFIKSTHKIKSGYQPSIFSARIGYLRISIIWITIILLSSALPSNASQDLKGMMKDQPDDQPWSINADNMTFDRHASRYMGTGHVVIARGHTRLTAEKVTFAPDTMFAEAEGNVSLTTGRDLLTCQRIELDLNAETGTIYNGSIFLSDGNFYIRGDKIEKTGRESYFAEKATVTTCEGDRPDWKLTARKLNVTIEGYGTIAHAMLWAKSIPVLYTPWLAFPVKIKRQTGLIPPHFGVSTRKGLNLEQPFFWAVNDHSDMTFNYNYMEKRGHQYGLEYRYLLSPKSGGMVMFDWLNDSKVDNGEASSSDHWGYKDEPTDYLRPNHERYWFRMKHNQSFGAGFTSKIDLDLVSDQDYLSEFKNTLTGFNRSQEAYGKFFGRDLDDYTDITRSNTINVSKTWTHYNLNTGLLWTDHVINRNLDLPDTSVQYLPTVDFDSSKHRLAQTPFHWALNSQYTYLFREVSPSYDSTTGTHRADVYPRAYLPFNLGHYLSLEPSVGVRETTWYATVDDAPETTDNEAHNRELWDARLDLSNAFYRIYKTKLGSINRIKHDVKPTVTYQYLPRVDQDDYPRFDSVDRIASMNVVTYSLTNTLTYRKQVSRDSGENDPDSPPASPEYRQFARLHIQQSYDLSDGKDPYNTLQYDDDGDSTEIFRSDYPFSTIYAKLEFSPQDSFSLDADADWSVYDGQFKTGNLSLNLKDRRNDQLKIEYRFAERTSRSKDNTKESFYATAGLNLTNQLSIFGSWERDLYTDIELEYGGGFLYASQCWSLEASHTVEERDHRYFFTINLYGLGKIGT